MKTLTIKMVLLDEYIEKDSINESIIRTQNNFIDKCDSLTYEYDQYKLKKEMVESALYDSIKIEKDNVKKYKAQRNVSILTGTIFVLLILLI